MTSVRASDTRFSSMNCTCGLRLRRVQYSRTLLTNSLKHPFKVSRNQKAWSEKGNFDSYFVISTSVVSVLATKQRSNNQKQIWFRDLVLVLCEIRQPAWAIEPEGTKQAIVQPEVNQNAAGVTWINYNIFWSSGDFEEGCSFGIGFVLYARLARLICCRRQHRSGWIAFIREQWRYYINDACGLITILVSNQTPHRWVTACEDTPQPSVNEGVLCTSSRSKACDSMRRSRQLMS